MKEKQKEKKNKNKQNLPQRRIKRCNSRQKVEMRRTKKGLEILDQQAWSYETTVRKEALKVSKQPPQQLQVQ